MQCALTKLSYLLSKPELSVAQVRSLIGTPMRGELTLPESKIPAALAQPTSIGQSLDNIQGLLSQVVRLSSSSSSSARSPRIVVEGDEEADEATAPWSWTAAEAASTESALFPFLIHLAAARDDADSVSLCLAAEAGSAGDRDGPGVTVGGGLANSRDAASGRSPLHVAALNGATRAANMLLEAGALVHVRAYPQRPRGVWMAKEDAAETVVGLDPAYCDHPAMDKMLKSACGCIREGIGCSVWYVSMQLCSSHTLSDRMW